VLYLLTEIETEMEIISVKWNGNRNVLRNGNEIQTWTRAHEM